MTDMQTIAQECYDRAKETDRPTRDIAVEMVAGLPIAAVRAMAVEFLVDVVSRAQRDAALAVERNAERRPTQMQEVPRKGTKARRDWEANTPEGRAYRDDMDAITARHDQMLFGVIGKALERYAEDLKIEWTAELLDSTFGLRDGTQVTWGDATVEQHRERRQMFLDNAHANMEGAARHEIALRQLEETGARTLHELTAPVA